MNTMIISSFFFNSGHLKKAANGISEKKMIYIMGKTSCDKKRREYITNALLARGLKCDDKSGLRTQIRTTARGQRRSNRIGVSIRRAVPPCGWVPAKPAGGNLGFRV